MNDRFSEDNFIEAAKAYQNIKAPSDLRERVLKGAAQAQAASEQSNVVAFQKEGRRAKRSSGKIYRLASIAACLAIMVAALPGWIPEAGPDDSVAINPRIITEGPVDVQPEPEDSTVPDVDLASEDDGIAVASEPEVLPDTQDEKETESEAPPAAAFSIVKSSDSEKETEKEEVAETDAPKTDGAPKAEIAISVGKLLPAMAAEGSMLQDMEVRLVSAQDGTCKVEITTADSKTAELTVSKNAENGRWEVTGTEEE